MPLNLARELAVIANAAFKYGIDPYFVAAIRRHENGPDGREFGILVVKRASGYSAQLDITCRSVRNRLAAYVLNPLQRRVGEDGKTRIAYTEKFVEYFGSKWVVDGAELWVRGVMSNYNLILTDPQKGLRNA